MSKVIGVRVDDDLLDILEAFSQLKKYTYPETFRKALMSYFETESKKDEC